MDDLSRRLPEVAQTRTVFTAFAFIIVGVCLKIALFPLHRWLPNAYLLIRFTFSIFGISFSFTTVPLQTIFVILGLLGIFVASTTAIFQKNVKHLFAYSSVAQIGYMIVGFSISTTTGLMATLLHLFNHALMKSALFLALGAVMYRIGSVQLSQFQGLGRQMPFTMAAIVVGGLSLIGVPLTVGFVSKWYLVLAALENGWWPVAVLVLLGSLLAIVYVWRIVEAAYFNEPPAGRESVEEAPLGFLIPVWLLVTANIYFGVDTRLSIQVAQAASQSLFGVSP
jgi:multicomponent Na+:H+ antiporter subunit D